MKKTKKLQKSAFAADLLVLTLLPVLATMLTLWLPINFFVSAFLFFGLPSIYLSFKNQRAIPRALIFALLFSICGGGFCDFFATNNNSWLVPTVLPVKLFGVVPYEDVFWGFLSIYLIIMFFENFFDHRVHKLIGKRMPLFTGLFLGGFFLIMLSPLFAIKIPVIHYFYLKGGIILMAIPVAVFLFNFPRFIAPFLKTVPYFFSLALLNEIVSLHKGYWSFPGREFIGWVSFGDYRFPLEELLFFVVIFSTTILTYFEFFDDNRVNLRPLGAFKIKASK